MIGRLPPKAVGQSVGEPQARPSSPRHLSSLGCGRHLAAATGAKLIMPASLVSTKRTIADPFSWYFPPASPQQNHCQIDQQGSQGEADPDQQEQGPSRVGVAQGKNRQSRGRGDERRGIGRCEDFLPFLHSAGERQQQCAPACLTRRLDPVWNSADHYHGRIIPSCAPPQEPQGSG